MRFIGNASLSSENGKFEKFCALHSPGGNFNVNGHKSESLVTMTRGNVLYMYYVHTREKFNVWGARRPRGSDATAHQVTHVDVRVITR